MARYLPRYKMLDSNDLHTAVFTMDTIAQFCAHRDMGECVEVDEELYYYFLDVLPPRYMGRTVTLVTGDKIRADFGFAKGAERITAFWQTSEHRFFAQGTTEISQGN